MIAKESSPGDKQLVAYLVPYTDRSERARAHEESVFQTLRAFLSKKLPEYMIPAIFQPIPEIPLTPHGKIDKEALPSPEEIRRTKTTYVPPTTELEKTLAKYPRLVENDRKTLEALTVSIVNKILHDPITHLKKEGLRNGASVEVIRKLFNLSEDEES